MKGILFTEILFNKTIRKEKTMTRRNPASLKVINENPDDWVLYDFNVFDQAIFENKITGSAELCKPTYKVGEVVYIKEPVAEYHYKVFIDGMVGNLHKPAYRYGMLDYQAVTYDGSTPRIIPRDGLKFQNKMFVGSDKARYYIRITSVKCERLYDISEEDCLKEGVDVIPTNRRKEDIHLCEFVYPDYEQYKPNSTIHQRYEYTYSPKISFFSLFRFANKVPKSKEIPNIWVFCYSYCLCDVNGNEL